MADSPRPTVAPEKSEPLPPMSRYVLGVYRRAPDRREISEAETARIQAGHLAYLLRLLQAGVLIAAGPLEEDGDLRGIFVCATGSIESARAALASDPAIVHGRLVLDLYTWLGPAGLKVEPPPRG